MLLSFTARFPHNTGGLWQTVTYNPDIYVCFSTMENRTLNKRMVWFSLKTKLNHHVCARIETLSEKIIIPSHNFYAPYPFLRNHSLFLKEYNRELSEMSNTKTVVIATLACTQRNRIHYILFSYGSTGVSAALVAVESHSFISSFRMKLCSPLEHYVRKLLFTSK